MTTDHLRGWLEAREECAREARLRILEIDEGTDFETIASIVVDSLRALRPPAAALWMETDGFGNFWTCSKGKGRSDCKMQVVRPGKVQCELCDEPAAAGEKINAVPQASELMGQIQTLRAIADYPKIRETLGTILHDRLLAIIDSAEIQGTAPSAADGGMPEEALVFDAVIPFRSGDQYVRAVSSVDYDKLRAYALRHSAPGMVPDGWQLVPKEPTNEMLNAARDWSVKKNGRGVGNDQATGCWQAMYDAASPQDERREG